MSERNNEPTVHGSTEQEFFDNGSRRSSRKGKGRFDLLPPHAIIRIAKHFENGAVHYGDHNWQLGQLHSRYMDSLLRHAFKYLGGARDEDHLAAIAWNACALMHQEEMIRRGKLDEKFDDLTLSKYHDDFLEAEFDPANEGRSIEDMIDEIHSRMEEFETEAQAQIREVGEPSPKIMMSRGFPTTRESNLI